MLKLASWNVNSLKVRLDQVLSWIQSQHIDILAMQEIKLIDEHFPIAAFAELGYQVSFSGQKTYNGVAIVSRLPMTEVEKDIATWIDPQRRILAATIDDLRIINLYVPNGSAPGADKYQYKLAWLVAVTEYLKQQAQRYPKLAVVGDFNIAPDDRDVHDPLLWEGCIHVSPPEREAFQRILDLGLIDSFRQKSPEEKLFSWWDYRAAAFRRNHGLRIDHILLSSSLASTCMAAAIDKEPRKVERPSDHAPVWVEF